MELKVWVEGIQRIVCGVTETTTCQDVVFALAHATGKSGRFTLIERWRCNERLLAPNEQPLKILSKWGEYSSDVQFILQWSESNKTVSPTQNQFMSTGKLKTHNTPLSSVTSSANTTICIEPVDKKLALNNSSHSGTNDSSTFNNKATSQTKSLHGDVNNEVFENNSSSKININSTTFSSPNSNDNNASNNSNNVRREVPPYKAPPSPPAPPPYRDPPPPQITSPNNQNNLKLKKNFTKDNRLSSGINIDENSLYNAQYKELVQLVNYQREKLSSQQADLTKYDAEIVFWESKGREQQSRLDFIAQELVKISNISRINSDKIKAMNYIEEENEIVRQQEKTLKSEITLLRSKLANCETELLQCKNKIRLLMEELQLEKRAQMRLGESQMQLERGLLTEIERLQHELELASQNTDRNQATAESLKREVNILESAIVEKKKEVESLVNEMKEANLLSLSIASADEVRHLLEGPIKAGSTRKIIGSPRQLENAVPTNKNPHGVWV